MFLMTPPLASPRRRVPTNVVQLLDQPSDYVSLLAACDAVVTKPGYGIVSDCLANRVPILFTDRGDFREYDVLADALPRLGHARYVPRQDVLAGRLGPHLDALRAEPRDWAPLATHGAQVVADRLARVGSRPDRMADRASRAGTVALLTDVVSIGVRLALLACAGLVAQVGWMLIWTLSYRLTHGNEFTYNFLVSQPLVWEKLRDFQVLANTLVPGVEILDVGPVHPDILYNAMVVGFVLAGLGYLAAILLIDVGVSAVRGALAVVVAFTAVFQITLFLLPGLFTTDIFSYLMYGHISAIYELNPYIYPPNYFPNHELLGPEWIHPIWHDQPSVYGPLWTAIGWIMAHLIAPLSLIEGVFAYKLLMNVVQVVNLVLVWWLLRRLLPN